MSGEVWAKLSMSREQHLNYTLGGKEVKPTEGSTSATTRRTEESVVHLPTGKRFPRVWVQRTRWGCRGWGQDKPGPDHAVPYITSAQSKHSNWLNKWITECPLALAFYLPKSIYGFIAIQLKSQYDFPNNLARWLENLYRKENTSFKTIMKNHVGEHAISEIKTYY